MTKNIKQKQKTCPCQQLTYSQTVQKVKVCNLPPQKKEINKIKIVNYRVQQLNSYL